MERMLSTAWYGEEFEINATSAYCTILRSDEGAMTNLFEEISAQIAAQMAAKASRPVVKDLKRSFIEILLHVAAVVFLFVYWYAAIDAYRTGRSGDMKIIFATISSMAYFFLMIPEAIHPREYNYLGKITEENARDEYVMARIFLGCVRVVVVAALSPIILAGWSPRFVLELVSAVSIPSMLVYCMYRWRRI